MMEERLYEYISGKTEYPVAFEEIPEQQYYLIEKTGTSKENHITTLTISIKSYGRTLIEAIQMNEAVKKIMDEFEHEADISESKLINDHNFTDTNKKKYRYRCIYEIVR